MHNSTSYRYIHLVSARFVVLVVGWLCLSLTPLTSYSFFSSTQIAPEQSFQASQLALTTLPDGLSGTVTPEMSATVLVPITTTVGSIAAHHDVRVTAATGDFCSSLRLSATTSAGTAIPTTPAGGFASDTVETFGDWSLDFALTAGATVAEEAICQLTFTVLTWQSNLQRGAGFVDEADFAVTVTFVSESESTAAVVLNEVFARPETGANFPLDREWIELFNAGTESADVEGWSFGEIWGGSEQQHVISVNNTCESGSIVGFARLVEAGATTLLEPGDFLLVEPCSGQSRISASDEIITLYNAAGELVSSFGYGSISVGQAWARVPDGTGEWVEQAPTPGVTNVLPARGGGTQGATDNDAEMFSLAAAEDEYEQTAANKEDPSAPEATDLIDSESYRVREAEYDITVGEDGAGGDTSSDTAEDESGSTREHELVVTEEVIETDL